jgi:hypothetical protein
LVLRPDANIAATVKMTDICAAKLLIRDEARQIAHRERGELIS